MANNAGQRSFVEFYGVQDGQNCGYCKQTNTSQSSCKTALDSWPQRGRVRAHMT